MLQTYQSNNLVGSRNPALIPSVVTAWQNLKKR